MRGRSKSFTARSHGCTVLFAYPKETSRAGRVAMNEKAKRACRAVLDAVRSAVPEATCLMYMTESGGLVAVAVHAEDLATLHGGARERRAIASARRAARRAMNVFPWLESEEVVAHVG